MVTLQWHLLEIAAVKKGLLEHTKPVQYPYSCLHVQLLWFCRCISLSKSDMENNTYTLSYCHFEGEKWVAFFVLGLGPLQIVITHVQK